jgi:hypothetical protein
MIANRIKVFKLTVECVEEGLWNLIVSQLGRLRIKGGI